MRISARLIWVLLILIPLVAAWIVHGGAIRGVEFSPQSWQRRAFSMFQVPLVDWPIGRTTIAPLPDDLVSYLAAQPWWPGSSSDADPYLVMSARTGRRSWTGDADIMSEFLGADPSLGPSAWLRWTRHHPQLASCLWPAVYQAVQETRYQVVPELFEAALRSTSREELERSLRRILDEVAR